MSLGRVLIAKRSIAVCRCGDISSAHSIDTKSVDDNMVRIALSWLSASASRVCRLENGSGVCDVWMSAGLDDALARPMHAARVTPVIRRDYPATAGASAAMSTLRALVRAGE